MVSAPSSSERAADVFRCPQGFVSGRGSGYDSLPWLCILAGRDDGKGASIGDGILAFAGVICAICSDTADFLVLWDLSKQIGQHRCITDVAPGDFDNPDLQRFLVDPEAGAMMHRAHPAVAQRAAAARRVQSLLFEFGLTPAARAKRQPLPGLLSDDPAKAYFT